MILRVTLLGEPILNQKTQAVKTLTPALETLIADMIDTMYDEEGIGLAAPQVDHKHALCVVDVTPCLDPAQAESCLLDGKPQPIALLMPLVLINPRITAIDPETSQYNEGCLSIPGVTGDVERPVHIEVSYQDERLQAHTLRCQGILSRCIQHEYDHLEGKLFLDYLDRPTLLKQATRIKQLKRESRDFLKARKKNGP